MGVVCADMAATERFYSTHFGFTRARVIPLGEGDEIIFLKSGAVYLELFKAKETNPAPAATGTGPEYPGWRHLAFKVDDVDATLAAMGADARITAGPMGFDAFIARLEERLGRRPGRQHRRDQSGLCRRGAHAGGLTTETGSREAMS